MARAILLGQIKRRPDTGKSLSKSDFAHGVYIWGAASCEGNSPITAACAPATPYSLPTNCDDLAQNALINPNPFVHSPIHEHADFCANHALGSKSTMFSQAELHGIRILHTDDDILVIDKPTGITAHASPGWNGPTITNCLSGLLAECGPQDRQGIVHRLDANTSGLMVLAKSALAYKHLKLQFRSRRVYKEYRALAHGYLDPSKGVIKAPIGRDTKHGDKFCVDYAGREAITHYETQEVYPGFTLLSVILKTGRTHQIRVHFSAMRHPLVGDMKYGADPIVAAKANLTRQWLHAHRLRFTHPATDDLVEFESGLPQDLQNSLEVLSRIYER